MSTSANDAIVKLHKRRTKRTYNAGATTNATDDDNTSLTASDARILSPSASLDDLARTADGDDSDDGSTDDAAVAAAPAAPPSAPSTPAPDSAHNATNANDNDTDDNNTSTSSSALDFGVLHPLEFEWTFWYDKRSTTAAGGRRKGEMQQYETNLREIGHFATVEDFWRYFHHIVKPTEMECNANCHLFKREIKPMWEDDSNAHGGKWVVVVGKQDRNSLDAIWEGVVLGLIGETMGDSRELCGAVCSVRKKGDKIAIWTRTKTDEQSIMAIGHNFKKALVVANCGHLKITYQFHEDALRTTTSYQNPVRHRL